MDPKDFARMVGAYYTMFIIAFFSVAMFAFILGQMFKKFRLNCQFYKNNPNLRTYKYKGGLRKMGHFVIESGKSEDRNFKVLLGFEMREGNYDFYGFVESHGKGKVVISTYFGRGPCKFVFALDRPAKDYKITFVPNPTASDKPDVEYPPHWWQKIF